MFRRGWEQTVFCAIEVLHAVELGHAFERTVEAVFPAMVGTLQNLGVAAGLGNDGRSVVTANVIEGAQGSIGSAHNNDGLSREPRGDEFPWLRELIGAGDELPGLAEDVEALEFGDARIDVPGCRDGGRFRQRGAVVVAGENLIDRWLHIYALG